MNKATYTLPVEFTEIFNSLKRDYNISKSRVVETAIITGFELMEEEFNDKSSHQIPVPKRLTNTVPITVGLSDYVFNRLNHYANKLDIKKSHLVFASLKYYLWKDHYDQMFLDQHLEELIDIVKDAYNQKIE